MSLYVCLPACVGYNREPFKNRWMDRGPVSGMEQVGPGNHYTGAQIPHGKGRFAGHIWACQIYLLMVCSQYSVGSSSIAVFAAISAATCPYWWMLQHSLQCWLVKILCIWGPAFIFRSLTFRRIHYGRQITQSTVSRNLVNYCTTVGTICTTDPEQVKVIVGALWSTDVNKVHVSIHDASTLIGVAKQAKYRVDKLPEGSTLIFVDTCTRNCLQCFDAVGWATGRASGL